ncbi:MAG: CHAP domain-containing protein [Ruminococcus sp.]|nr:CHAP domain-containing protein [Ruminococcus sp.]
MNVKKKNCFLLVVLFILLYLPFSLSLPAEAAYENTHVNTGDQATDLVEVARTQVGYHEGTNNYTKYNVWFGSLNDYGYNYAWCQTFVAWCANQAGIPTSMIPRVSGTISGMDFFKKNETWKDAGITPEKGDIIYLYSKSSSGYHVGIVADVSGGQISTIEGNSSDRVAERTYSVGNSSIVGYGCPEYVRPNPPTYSILYANKATITLNEDIVFTASSDYATGYLIGINDINGRYATENMPNGSLTMKFSKAGSYSAYVTSYNTAGYCDSALIYFTVIDSAPTFSQLTSSKNKILIDEEIEFNAISDNATAYWIGIDHNGERYLTKEMVNGTLKCSFSDAGVYTAYVTSSNAYGGSDSKLITFTVVDSAPTFSQLTSSTNKISIGEEIEFNAISDNATAYWIGIDHNGGRYLTKEMVNGTLKCSFSDAGVYTAYVTSSNKYGGIDSKLITFTVYINENEMIYNGDCNMDGNLNIIDIVLLQKFLTNVQDIDIADWKAADLSQDNILNISDLCIMKNKLLSIEK